MSLYPSELVTAAVAVLGLLFGSFLNVVVHRLPRGESLVKPRSRCPSCGETIVWYHNVPVLSWLALRGRCARCSASISIRYPIVELSTAAVVVLLHLRFGSTVAFAVLAPFGLALVALFVIDLEHRLLPDAITIPGSLLAVAVAPLNPHLGGPPATAYGHAFGGAILGFGLLWGLAAGYARLRGIDGLGGGDIKLAALIGALVGVRGLFTVLMLASLGGLLFGLTLIALRRASMQSALPFGCFLTPALFLVILLGPDPLWDGWQTLLVRYLYVPLGL